MGKDEGDETQGPAYHLESKSARDTHIHGKQGTHGRRHKANTIDKIK